MCIDQKNTHLPKKSAKVDHRKICRQLPILRILHCCPPDPATNSESNYRDKVKFRQFLCRKKNTIEINKKDSYIIQNSFQLFKNPRNFEFVDLKLVVGPDEQDIVHISSQKVQKCTIEKFADNYPFCEFCISFALLSMLASSDLISSSSAGDTDAVDVADTV